MNNKLYILCDHGLGNRLGGLIGGLKAAEILRYDPIICWPMNNYCNCNLLDLFDIKEKIADDNFSNFLTNQRQDKNLPWFFISTFHNNEIGSDIYDPHFDVLNIIKNKKIDAIYSKNKVVKSIASKKDITQILNYLQINKKILKNVKNFCNNNNITSSTIGLHVRKTDSHDIANEEEIYSLVSSNRNQKYFLCSDDKNTENKFLKLGNVTVNHKNSEVKKLVEQDWRETYIDSNGRIIPWNVNRDSNQVIDAFIDMLILSRTSINKLSRSTFRIMAEKFSTVDIFKGL
jgi:hypothetical protein